MSGLWQLSRPLVLASKSRARRALLEAAAVPFEIVDAAVDERAVELPMLRDGADGAAVAAALARAKALAASAMHPGRLVVGADQTLGVDGQQLTKPADLAAAKTQLLSLAGRTHTLFAAFCLARDGAVCAAGCIPARLTCRAFDAGFVDRYLALAGESVLGSVGAYALEGLGIHLFERIEGDHSTILGLPMLALLAALRDVEALR